MWKEIEENEVSALNLTGKWTFLKCISVMMRVQTYGQKEISFALHLDCPSKYALGLPIQY